MTDMYNASDSSDLLATPLVQLLRANVDPVTGGATVADELVKQSIDGITSCVRNVHSSVPILPITSVSRRAGWHESGAAVIVGCRGFSEAAVVSVPVSTAGVLPFKSSMDRVSIHRQFAVGLDTVHACSRSVLSSVNTMASCVDGTDFDHYSSSGRNLRHRSCIRFSQQKTSQDAPKTTPIEPLKGPQDVPISPPDDVSIPIQKYPTVIATPKRA
jgi:hypothetical protein